jgi:RNA polymerase sigma factor (sigma-70 family)
VVDRSAQTTELVAWLDRWRAGDQSARDELIRGFQLRLEVLARKMLRHYPKVGRWADADDLLQNALVRLLRALETIRPGSTREFLGLVAEQMRRELVDLSRHFYGPLGQGTHEEHLDLRIGESGTAFDPPDRRDDPSDIERWYRFHQEVQKLPDRQREVVDLVFYHGWTRSQVAALFRVDVRTARRWWKSALVNLHAALSDDES